MKYAMLILMVALLGCNPVTTPEVPVQDMNVVGPVVASGQLPLPWKVIDDGSIYVLDETWMRVPVPEYPFAPTRILSVTLGEGNVRVLLRDGGLWVSDMETWYEV